MQVHTQHYKYNRTGKHREEDLRAAREAEDCTMGSIADLSTGATMSSSSSIPDLDDTSREQLSHEANEYRNWCKLMELNAMKNIATSDMLENADTGGEGSAGEESTGGGRGESVRDAMTPTDPISS